MKHRVAGAKCWYATELRSEFRFKGICQVVQQEKFGDGIGEILDNWFSVATGLDRHKLL